MRLIYEEYSELLIELCSRNRLFREGFLEKIVRRTLDKSKTDGFRLFAEAAGPAILKRNPGILRQDAKDAEREKELEKFCMDYEQNKAELSSLDSRLSESSVREKELSLRLGAALYEQCSFGLLDRSAFAPVYRDAEKERNLESTAPSGFIPKIGTAIEKKKMEKGKEARLMSYAELAMLQSAPVYGNPLEILSALKALSAESAAMRIKRDKLSEYISGHRGEYLKASKGGLDTQRERVRKCDDEARSRIVRAAEIGAINSSDIVSLYREFKTL